MNLVYINNGRCSVFDSQVLALLKYFSKDEFFENVILLFGVTHESDIKWLEAKDTEGIKIFYYRSYPNYPPFNYFIRRNMKSAMRKLIKDFSVDFVHIRGELTSWHFKSILGQLDISKRTILTDVRGASIEELLEYSGLSYIKRELKLANTRRAFNNLKRDTKISVVSKSLKNLVEESIDNIKVDISINPCLVNESFVFKEEARISTRKELGVHEDEILIVFSSAGTSKWQSSDSLIGLIRSGCRVLNLSRKTINNDRVINKFVPYDDMSKYLSAADAAFIWRDKSIVNEVASPVKFSEYLACGLPILHNGTVNMINQLTDNGVDSISKEEVEDIDMSTIYSVVKKSNRLKISQKGISLFGISSVANRYKEYYSKSEVEN